MTTRARAERNDSMAAPNRTASTGRIKKALPIAAPAAHSHPSFSLRSQPATAAKANARHIVDPVCV